MTIRDKIYVFIVLNLNPIITIFTSLCCSKMFTFKRSRHFSTVLTKGSLNDIDSFSLGTRHSGTWKKPNKTK